MTCETCATFTIQSNTYTVYWTKPSPSGESGTLDNDVSTFDFWDEDFGTVNEGLKTQPLTLQGVVTNCVVGRVCFPICFPACFSGVLKGEDTISKVKKLWEIQKNHEEVTITDLGDCLDAVYIIVDFELGTIKKAGEEYFKYRFVLEKVRDI